jgi:hypothetical protein
MTGQRLGATIGFVIVAAALVLQFALSIPARVATGDSVIGAIVFFFSFFTILTNIMVAAVYLSAITAWGWLGWWRTAWVRGMTAGAIFVVMLVYHFVLAGLVRSDLWFQVADKMLHYLDPTYYVLWWLLGQKHGQLCWGELPKMLVYPLCYLIWAMGRGAVAGDYPYPFLDANKLGYGQVALNCVGVLAAFVLSYALVIGIDRWLGRRALRAV